MLLRRNGAKNEARKNTCLLVVNSFSSCSINCNVAFEYLHLVSTAATANVATAAVAVAVHLITQLSGLCKDHVVCVCRAHSFYCYCKETILR